MLTLPGIIAYGFWAPVSLAILALLAIVTEIVVLIIEITKFSREAWAVIIFIPFIIFILKKIRSHYNDMSDQLHLPLEDFNPTTSKALQSGRNVVIIPVATPTNIVAQTLKYAKSISKDVVALHIATDEADAQKVAEK